MPKGGYRPNAGRPKGRRDNVTLERLKVEGEVKQRIMKQADRLLDAKFKLSQGCSYLYRIDKDSKGNNKPAELVTNADEIKRYLDEDKTVNPDSYYFITTEKPDGKSIEDLFNRVFGKPRESVEHTGSVIVSDVDIDKLTPEERKEYLLSKLKT